MLDGYFPAGSGFDKKQRLLAVQAALEVAKAAVGSGTSSTASRVDDDIANVAKEVSNLADAIQAALEK